MRTYSHILLTYAAVRRARPSGAAPAVSAALGATLPDIPALVGGSWLTVRHLKRFSRQEFDTEVCGRKAFSGPDAALHSTLPIAAALTLYGAAGAGKRDPGGAALTFLLGWAGHVAVDTLTHGNDARPIFWPLSRWRFQSPLSYRERDRHGLAFTIGEHAALLLAAWRLLRF